ncbi:TIGR02646 family protein [Dyadobacter luteus]|uniref:TIGR02646 family protein n=1 Tax=Dyadobacter luteus TaxID=2259619 RepID=A0A3D8YFJ3_9BACT|nr:retron system putative HNH endonuclease [Dyadobacter luteus]REA63442.1 TIGR02646 family protein [Dyadobacter luteus]
MRKIDKQASLKCFDGFKEKNPSANWSDFSAKNSSGYSAYQETKLFILTEEQECLCGYTELVIDDERNCHLDHYRQKAGHMFPEQTFYWDNLVAACNDEDFGAKFKDNKSGIKKSDYAEFFNPVMDAVQDYFYYNEIGEIEPHPTLSDPVLQAKVQKTIEVFNLQDKSLVNRRKTVIDQIRAYADLTKEETVEALKFGGFISLVQQYTNV